MHFKRSLLLTVATIWLVMVASSFGQTLPHLHRYRVSLPDGDPLLDALWERADSLIGSELPLSARPVVDSIYTIARARDKTPHVIKAILYRGFLSLQQGDEHERDVNAMFDEFASEMPSLNVEGAAVLNSIRAELLWLYWSEQRWRLRNRTEVENDTARSIATWSPRRIVDTAGAWFHASLREEMKLAATPIRSWEAMLATVEGSDALRPTLFDLLAWRALGYCTDGRSGLTKPERVYMPRGLELLVPAKRFVLETFNVAESADPTVQALLLFQRLCRRHLDDVDPTAMIDLEINRLAWCTGITADTGAVRAQLSVLDALARDHDRHEASAQALYAMADIHYNEGDYRRSLAICADIVMKFPSSKGAANGKTLRARIEAREIAIQTEQTVSPDVAFVASMGYRNIETAWLRLVPITADLANDVSRNWYDSSTLKSLLATRPVVAWRQALPVETEQDHKSHTVDIRVPGFPTGEYLLLCSVREDFPLDTNQIAYVRITATQLSAVESNGSEGTDGVFVRHASSGGPIPDATVRFMDVKYNSARRRQEYVQVGLARTDRRGWAAFPRREDPQRCDALVVENGRDRIVLDARLYTYRRSRERETISTIIFTDRVLYRPGQTIYFKGIAVSGNRERPEYRVVPRHRITIQLFDNNDEKVAEQSLTTNEFGSVHGSFTAPAGTLTGAMTIRVGSSSRVIRVEEYKRPKFEVAFDKTEGAYGLNDTVAATGNARAYAGSPVDAATVRYRVVRNARFPYWWGWHDIPPSSPSKEIAQGVTTTGADGSFTIPFIAEPDALVPRASLPVFSYTITVDVIDINGETHSASTSVTVGYTSTVVSVSAPEYTERGTPSALVVSTTNLDGSPIPFEGRLFVERLREPARATRPRILPRPDRFVMPHDEFARAFPLDPYDVDSSFMGTWTVAREEINTTIRTGEAGVDSIRLGDMPSGAYRARYVAIDRSGDTIRSQTHFTIYSPPNQSTPATVLPYATRFIAVPNRGPYEPGDTFRLRIGSSLRDGSIVYRCTRDDIVLVEGELDVDGSLHELALPVKEEHRGGFSVRMFMVHDRRMQTYELMVGVPWSNKELRIQATTFRDRLTPGSKEELRFTVTGSRGEKVAAEMVACMYDASLDAIVRNYYPRFGWPSTWAHGSYGALSFGSGAMGSWTSDWNVIPPTPEFGYDVFSLMGRTLNGVREISVYARRQYRDGGDFAMQEAGGAVDRNALPPAYADRTNGVPSLEVKSEPMPLDARDGGVADLPDARPRETAPPSLRRNLQETAFFVPEVRTNAAGEVIVAFTVPEALTRWRFDAFAHTVGMMVGTLQKTAVTQKELMVLPNIPRFVREGDTIYLTTKITNLSERDLNGTARLSVVDAPSGRAVDSAYALRAPEASFGARKGGSSAVQWRLVVPDGAGMVLYRITATAGEFSDGEEGLIPVLPNRMLVTETLPINVRGNTSRTYEMSKLLQSGASSTLRSVRLTLEMTSNPAWYAVQALPYIMEYPYECAEQIFNRFYANAIASHIVNSSPRIRGVFESWKGTDALVSALQKNEELKGLLLQETPWVMQGRNETERKQRIALLFDLNHMRSELRGALAKLEQMQRVDGSFGWFPSMPGDRYMTTYIVSGIGRMLHLGIGGELGEISGLTQRALTWVDEEMVRSYQEMKKVRGFDPQADHLGYSAIQYLYARSYYAELDVADETREMMGFWVDQARRYWNGKSFLAQAMIAVALRRLHVESTPSSIIASFRERALHSDELGMYWKVVGSWWWYDAPIETQATIIEAFDEVVGDQHEIDEMKIWLLKQKQVQDWGTTRSTADACYALLKRGSAFLASDQLVRITLGSETIDPRMQPDMRVEAGTGYFSIARTGGDIRTDMGRVSVTKTDSGIAWGALYWQYFEQLDRITAATSPLSIEKRLFRKRNSSQGPVLDEVTPMTQLAVGDAVVSRLTLRTDRDMEYIHLKDMRGAGLEPVNQLSRYRWQGGLGYYEAPGDASTNFFLSWLPKGTWVFEYESRATIAGTFANGITTVQSMYAPEFAAHTAGMVVRVGSGE